MNEIVSYRAHRELKVLKGMKGDMYGEGDPFKTLWGVIFEGENKLAYFNLQRVSI